MYNIFSNKKESARKALALFLLFQFIAFQFPAVPAYAGSELLDESGENATDTAVSLDSQSDTTEMEDVKGDREEGTEEGEEENYSVEAGEGSVGETLESYEDESSQSATNEENKDIIDGGEASVKTGDAVAEGSIVNEGNESNISLENEDLGEGATEEEELENTEDVEGKKTSSGSLTVNNENDVESQNELEVSGSTGNNTASSVYEESASIETGNATAGGSVINFFNTTILDSNGFLLFLNSLSQSEGSIDLRELFNFNSSDGDDELCRIFTCFGDVSVQNNNNANINNDVTVNASTGGNNSESADGDSTIKTGDAYASSNVVNVVNTNIVGANYMVSVINLFGDWFGELIFPNAEKIMELFRGGKKLEDSNLSVENNNTAIIGNNVETTASTGGNSAVSEDGESMIETGNAVSASNVINEVNTNYTNVDSFLVIFRIYGQWIGTVFNLPTELGLQEDENGFTIFNGVQAENGSQGLANVNIENDNNAEINNNVSVSASTGNNQATSQGGNVNISTGNAYAVSNIVNVANTNIIGRNWMLAIVNIFGDWNGNVSFGQPDLWVGVQAVNEKEEVTRGAKLAFQITVSNIGDANASNVRVTSDFIDGFINSEETEWLIDSIPAGHTVQIAYKATVDRSVPYGRTKITNKVKATARESEPDLENNSDELSFMVVRSRPVLASQQLAEISSPVIEIRKESDKSGAILEGESVNYKIVIKNNGGASVYNAFLHDWIINGDGSEVFKQTWQLDEIKAGEEIIITYESEFKKGTPLGVYTNLAQVLAYTKDEKGELKNRYRSDISATSLVVFATIEDLEDAQEKKAELQSRTNETPVAGVARQSPPKPPVPLLVSADESVVDSSSMFPKAEASDKGLSGSAYSTDINNVASARTGMPAGMWLFIRNLSIIMFILFAGYWISGVMLRRKQR
jgi:uncharacterized repeat protein (TIGR01451 family)